MVKATLIRGTEILRQSVEYPQINITPIESLDPDLEWLIDFKEDRPTFDNTIEKLVQTKDITQTPHPAYSDFNQYRIWFDIVDLTILELEEAKEQEAKDKQSIHIETGLELFTKTYRKIWRKKNKPNGANLPRNQARKLMRWFQPVYIFLNYGNWAEAEDEILKQNLIDNIINENSNAMTNIYEFLRDNITDYINNDYDL